MLIRGDARALPLRNGRVDCCVTSPPYFGLRDYGHAGQIGLEPTPDLYVQAIVAVFRGVRRVLKDAGTCWINIGDSYANDTKWGGSTSGKHVTELHSDSGIGRRRHTTGLKSKDLIGIPWRVAFALQQPYVHNIIRRESDRAWLAALVDGEGTMTILQTSSPHGSGDSFPPVLQVRMCDLECIAKAAEITGYGRASPRQDPPSQGGIRGSYQWRLNGGKAARIAADIYPFLLVKRKQAIIVWNHQKVRDSYETKKGVCVPSAAVEKQQACRELIQRLNRREPVDIPSWMEEPTVEVTPGWYLRSDVIWAKPNPMPESVTDRPTKAHEYLFLLTKSERYHYDSAAISEELSATTISRFRGGVPERTGGNGLTTIERSLPTGHASSCGAGSDGRRNRRSVWTIPTMPYAGAHFATMPEALVEPCILAGCPLGGLVLDPFVGSGTVVSVAQRLGRRGVGVDLSYQGLAKKRTAQRGLRFAEIPA